MECWASPWKRLLAAAGVWTLASCSSGWPEDDTTEFLNDCMTNVRLEDEQLREAICTCWQKAAAEKYSLAQVNSGDQPIQADFVEMGKGCSSEHGVRAYLPAE